ncbi:hypothetical protein TNCV_2759381 [Trichonephila clavipes]|nr:hypothetical protein TNCV_2759381 [Trichonephila clavipes]
MREKGGNSLVPGPDYTVDALKLPNQALGGSGESLQKCVALALSRWNTTPLLLANSGRFWSIASFKRSSC